MIYRTRDRNPCTHPRVPVSQDSPPGQQETEVRPSGKKWVPTPTPVVTSTLTDSSSIVEDRSVWGWGVR